MDTYKNSLILSFFAGLWDRTCKMFKTGLIYRCITFFADIFRRGFIMHTLRSGAAFEEKWETSALRRAAEWCFNLVPELLTRLYRKFQPVADRSIVFTCVEAFGRYSVPCFCVMIFSLMIIPQSAWNNLYSLTFAALSLVFYWCAGVKNAEKRISLRNVGVLPCLYACVVFLCLLWSDSFSLSFRFIFFSITCILCVVVFTNAFDSDKKLLWFVIALGAGLSVNCLYALLQRIVGVEADKVLTDLTVNSGMPGRVYSFFENPNSYANLLVYFAPLMLCMFFFAPRLWQRLSFLATFALCGLALVMTYARGGWLAFAFSMFILMCLLCPRWIPLVVFVGFCCLPILPGNILNRLLTIFNTADSSIYTRTYIYSAMLRIIGLNPLFGVGLGAGTVKHSIEIAGVYTAEAAFIHGHNIYFQIWAESGILGLMSFIGAVYFAMRGGSRRRNKPGTTPLLKGIICGSISGLAGSLVFGITDYPWSYPRVMVLYWLLFALLCAATAVSKQNDKAGITNVK